MVLPFSITTKSAEETQKIGALFGDSLVKSGSAFPHVFCLWGDLGSGKTTFVQGLAKHMGITRRLLSPTFIIVRHYDVPDTSCVLYHLDLYRMQTVSDVEGIGMADMLNDPKAFIMIEWPERLGDMLPGHRIDIRFSSLPDGSHRIEATEEGNKVTK